MPEIVKQPNSNLRRGNPAWGKGVSGNPAGRKPKEKLLSWYLSEMLGKDADFIAPGAGPDDKTWLQLVAKAMLLQAAKGNVQAAELIFERLEGKVKDTLDINANVSWSMLHQLAKDKDANGPG